MEDWRIEAGVTNRNSVRDVQFIASVLAGERWEIRLRNIELHQRKLQQSLSSAVDDVPRTAAARLRPARTRAWRQESGIGLALMGVISMS